MAGRSPKCKHCKNEVDKSLEHVKNYIGYFHTECFEQASIIKEKTPRARKQNFKPCAHCNEDVDKNADETRHKGSNKHYHVDCFEKMLVEERLNNMKPCLFCGSDVSPSDEDTVKNYKGYFHKECFDKHNRKRESREKLCEYIAEKYNISYPTGYMMKQLDDFHKQRSYSYKAMLSTLKYMFEVEKLVPKEGVGLGLITFYYEKAKTYHLKLLTVGKTANGLIIDNKVVKVRAIEPTKRTKAGYIDMSSL